MMGRRSLLLAGSALALPVSALAQESDALAARLRGGGLVLLIRHAQTTPGVGDPPGFRLDDCSTQRNLSEAGRDQARAWGEWLRRNDIATTRVLSSRWCRCRETAELLSLAPVELFPPLDSFFGAGGGAGASRKGIRGFVESWGGPALAVMVTHQVNVTAAYEVSLAMGEALVIQPDPAGGRVLGRLPPQH